MEEVSKELKIPFNFIQAFEDDNWRKLEPNVYAKKYLLAYLKFLGEDSVDLYPYFIKEWANPPSSSSVLPDPLLKVGGDKGGFIISHLFRKISVFALIFLFFLYLSWQFYNFFRPPKLEIFSPNDNAIIDSPLIEVWGRTEKEMPLFINGVEVMLLGDGTFKEEIGLQKGINVIKIEAVKKYGGRRAVFKKVLFE